MENIMTSAVALDLGSTRIKAVQMSQNGHLGEIVEVAAPPLTEAGLIMEGDAMAYINDAIHVLNEAFLNLPNDTPIGIASQRSSFLLWDKITGQPVTPLISWQDRRAYDWCTNHQNAFSGLELLTGLFLSPHYAGPKLAYLLSTDSRLKKAAARGNILFGTLETFFLWKLTQGNYHQTDLSMASRTLMADPLKNQWSKRLLSFFDIPLSVLPEIVPTFGRNIPLSSGGRLTSSVADQAASFLGSIGSYDGGVIVNLGTGGFVIHATGEKMKHMPGYLSGPLFCSPRMGKQYAIEGTINGIGYTMSQQICEHVELMDIDMIPSVFCLPDYSGAGAPLWVADLEFLMSEGAECLSPEDSKRIVMEGIIFRINQILQDICGLQNNPDILLSGGLSSEEFLCKGLAACTGHTVLKPKQKETTLLGAGKLALGLAKNSVSLSPVEVPGNAGIYLKDKYLQWKTWLTNEIDQHKSLKYKV